jgi:hypothetical protein
MAGHQPELFHPGVWVKNFALNGLARAHGAAAVNLVVDNDTAKATALHVPALAAAQLDWPHAVIVPFDHWTGEVPYEERAVRDEAVFAALPEHVAPFLEGWDFVPLLPAFWAEVGRQARRTNLLGERLASARRSVERDWGCHNLELPVSCLCRTEPFAWFACHLLCQLPRFHAVHNRCLYEFRRGHGIRSRNHPVPALAAEEDWLEVPFWAWRSGQGRRGRLIARHTETTIELRVGSERWPSLPRGRNDTPEAMIQVWQSLERQGLKVRSRALTNTLFARLLLADLFIHGIGGGAYDELTDEIVRRFFGCEPPGYLVLSATLLLPLPLFPARPQVCRRLARELRDLHYNPQRHLPASALADASVAQRVAQKQAWISRQPASGRERRQRFEALRGLTAQLRPLVAGRVRDLQHQHARCRHEVQANAVLQRRDYAFCLYPEALLRPLCTRFLAAEAAPALAGRP